MAASRVGASLRSARERAGWSREFLAYRSGLSWAAIAQIESGRRRELRLGSLLALANALGVSADYLIGSEAAVSPKLLGHQLFIYGSDDEYLASAASFLIEGIARADSVLAVTTKRQIGLLRDALGDDAFRVEFRDSAEWYRSPVGTLNDFRDYVRERFDRGAHWIRVLGEPIWTGRSEAEVLEWTRYESMINLSLASSPVTIMCPYDARSAPDGVLAVARHTHPEVAEVGSVSPSIAYREPEEFLLTFP